MTGNARPLAMRVILGNNVYCEDDGGPCTAACYGDPNDNDPTYWIIFGYPYPDGVDNGCDARGCASAVFGGDCGYGYLQFVQAMWQRPAAFRTSRHIKTSEVQCNCFRTIECVSHCDDFTVCRNGTCQPPGAFDLPPYGCCYCESREREGGWTTQPCWIDGPCRERY